MVKIYFQQSKVIKQPRQLKLMSGNVNRAYPPFSLSLSLCRALSLSPSQTLFLPLNDDETHRRRLTGIGNDCWLGLAV
jgi:hypothetical protein